MARSTPATHALTPAGAAFEVVAYDYDPRAGARGMQAADALGGAPASVLKTLMILIDGRPACAMLAADRTLPPRAAAAALGAKLRR